MEAMEDKEDHINALVCTQFSSTVLIYSTALTLLNKQTSEPPAWSARLNQAKRR